MRESGHGILATPATQTPELRNGFYDNGLVGIESCCRNSWHIDPNKDNWFLLQVIKKRAATSPSNTATWRCFTTPEASASNNSKAFPADDPRGGLREDFAVTRADDTSVRSHPQLFNGRLRSTTASCGTTASSRRAPPEVVVTAYPAWPAAPPVCRAPSPNTNQR